MVALVTPIHTGTVNSKPVRFFRSPFQGPDMPWHAMDDLLRALDLPRDFRLQHLRQLRRKWAADVRTVGTPDGITTIAPHFMARGMLDGMKSIGRASEAVDTDYCFGATAAMEAITAGIPDALDRMTYAMHAFNRHGAQGEAH